MDYKKFILRVMAGTDYDKQEELHVNTSKPVTINTEDLSAQIHVRVKDFRGVPSSSPSTSPYFSHPKHTSDRYSISFSFTPKRTFNGDDIVFGNDFDHPIRERLPPGFGYAFNYVKSWIDPGLEGDPLSDEPWLYGPLLSSVNVLRIGGKAEKLGANEDEEIDIVEEGASDDEGHQIRERLQIPTDNKNRMKFFLDDEKRRDFEFEEGRNYSCDFFNGYLDFNEFSLRLPFGLVMRIVKHWDGQPLRTHSLRYVLRNRKTRKLLFVISFNLVPTDEEAKKAAEAQTGTAIEQVIPPAETNEHDHNGDISQEDQRNEDDDVD